MYGIPRKKAGWWRHIPLLTLYALFFMVQWFYNLDVPAAWKAKASTTVANTARGRHETIARDHQEGRTGSKVKLNKRFHPSVAPSLIPSYAIRVVRYIQTTHPAPYQDPLYNASSAVVHSLRGPPLGA